jgi:starch phosphorylase
MKHASKAKVAYLCMEYAVSSPIKTYAGGLGILAGDYLKGAKEQGHPIIGIGIKWKQGYTGQKITPEGRVYDSYQNYPYTGFEDTGKTVKVQVRKRDVTLRIWKAKEHGVSELILLDTDHPDNADGWITGQLYGWFGEERVAQEIVLGVGGVRALQALGIHVDLYHFNEGHAVLAALEILRQKREKGLTFQEAWKETRKEIVFTTHTPIKEGNESHPHELLQYMGANLGLTVEEMHSIGGTPFNMTVAALNLSHAANGVAQLHGVTARQMWADVKGAPEIIGITNGIHRGTWVDSRVEAVKDESSKLWDLHMELKQNLIDFVQKRTGQKLAKDKLLVGFARRAAPYKRSNLIFQAGPEVLKAIKDGSLQIVFSGKAHPLDDTGKGIVQEIVRYAREMPQNVVFLEDYDMEIGAMLTRGSDVWLNNPRRPLEACGTSGMKAAMNGVLNVSILDGWWPEACEHGVNGWAIGDDHVPATLAEQDERDAKFLGDVLVKEVIPTYYKDHKKWVQMMQASIRTITKTFSVETMLDEYYKHLYSKKPH